jgi:hypothetical protein
MVSPFLRAAVAGLDVDVSQLDWFDDGPAPVLRRREQALLALWCAERVVRLLRPDDQARAATILGAAKQLLAGDEAERAGAAGQLERLRRADLADPMYRDLAVVQRADPANRALAVVELAGEGARRASRRGTRAPVRIARLAARYAVEAINSAEGVGEAIAFTMPLAHELARLELCGAVSRRLPHAPMRILQLVYRGHDGTCSRVWVARLDDGSWGVLVRAGYHAWTTGARNEVAAHVPDRWFEAAARAIMATHSTTE